MLLGSFRLGCSLRMMNVGRLRTFNNHTTSLPTSLTSIKSHHLILPHNINPSFLTQQRSLSLKINTINPKETYRSITNRFQSKRFISSTYEQSKPQPDIPISSPALSRHLFMIAGLVFTIVIVGGLTRLTESGLSITEWNLVSGIKPPMNEQEWNSEFEKYKQTPEFKLLNQSIELDQFKTIYYWEWAHRILGRIIGIGFCLPLPFLYRRGLIRGHQTGWSLFGIGTLIGAQGGLGWYMVKSGLDQVELDRRDGIPRVSQYRLAAHLLMAFTVYALCIRLGGGIWRDWRLAIDSKPLGRLSPSVSVQDSIKLLESKTASRARVMVTTLTALVFITAGSGAFVAGLDAGLVYNTFPKMGERWIPSKGELISQDYYDANPSIESEQEQSKSIFKNINWMRNFFENPTTVQFDHRLLATFTFLFTSSYFVYIEKFKRKLPKNTLIYSRLMMSMITLQISLGISTLIYLVPTYLALSHQIGSLLLLSFTLANGLTLRRPGFQSIKLFNQFKLVKNSFVSSSHLPYHHPSLSSKVSN